MNLYILTEERPKVSTLRFIITRFLRDKKFVAFVDNLRILPIIENERFLFCYEVIGVRCNKIAKIYLKIISGGSSFVDYLVFFQATAPKPRYAINASSIKHSTATSLEM